MSVSRYLTIPALALLALSLVGCATDGACTDKAKYREAESITVIQGTGDLRLPESPSALRIPPLTEAAQAAASEPVTHGKGRRGACLDVPPPMPPQEPEPTPAAPQAAK